MLTGGSATLAAIQRRIMTPKMSAPEMTATICVRANAEAKSPIAEVAAPEQHDAEIAHQDVPHRDPAVHEDERRHVGRQRGDHGDEGEERDELAEHQLAVTDGGGVDQHQRAPFALVGDEPHRHGALRRSW